MCFMHIRLSLHYNNEDSKMKTTALKTRLPARLQKLVESDNRISYITGRRGEWTVWASEGFMWNRGGNLRNRMTFYTVQCVIGCSKPCSWLRLEAQS